MEIIIKTERWYESDIKKLTPIQKECHDFLLDLIKANPAPKDNLKDSRNTNLGNNHELKQFNHGNWKVRSVDIVDTTTRFNFLKLNETYYRGDIRLTYEYQYTTKGDLVINLCNCSNHKFKNKHYSDIDVEVQNKLI